MARLNEAMERADQLRDTYRQNTKMANIPGHKAVAVTDFTSGSLCEYGSGGHFEIFTMALCTSKELDLGDLADLRPAEPPPLKLPFDSAGSLPSPPAKKKRRTKEEIAASDEKPVKNAPNLRMQLQSARRERKIPFTSEPTTPDTPFIVYFDFVCEKFEHVAQNDVYVRRSTEVLVENGLFKRNGITELEWFSDGCGKVCLSHCHFSSYLALQDVQTSEFCQFSQGGRLWPDQGRPSSLLPAHLAGRPSIPPAAPKLQPLRLPLLPLEAIREER